MIEATIHDDDNTVSGTFDATPWFAEASPYEIAELAACGWGNDYPADHIAYFMEDQSEIVRNVLAATHGETLDANPNGFEVSVNKDQAMAWLRANRPNDVAMLVTRRLA